MTDQMDMDLLVSGLTLAGLAAFGAVAFGWRILRQHRRTGDTGLRGLPHTPAEWGAGILLTTGIVAAVLSAVGVMSERFELWNTPADALVRTAGAVAFLVGFAVTVRAQLDMGDSWRIGVDAGEITTLVTHGIFRFVRNPIYSGMVLAFVGVALLVPMVLSSVAVVLIALGLEIQVRMVEEPYLQRYHGGSYGRYAASVGRFLPAVGRLRS